MKPIHFYRPIFKVAFIVSFSIAAFLVSSCKKYLDEKPQQTLTIPSTLNDVLALLDNVTIMNTQGPRLLPVLDDDYYVLDADWQANIAKGGVFADDARNYNWDKDATSYTGWQVPYIGAVYYSNVVLDQLPNINFDKGQQSTYNYVKGAALFYRSYTFLSLAQLYCKPYASSAATDPGIVLRTTSNIQAPVTRSTVQETYDRIISDLQAAVDLLPDTTIQPTRPNKAAALGTLARTFLFMRDYANAYKYADLALKRYSTLIDYNTITPTATPPFARYNKETIFFIDATRAGIIFSPVAKIDTVLYSSYDNNDLRKTLFFLSNSNGTKSFKGSYDGTSQYDFPFSGIATDELMLIRAESAARNGDAQGAITDLNTLMVNRWKKNLFTPFTASSPADALAKILTERRKELLCRGLRWSDLRRFNLEGANITLKRVINGATFTLPPNDPRWVLLIPNEVIGFSGIEQNPR